MLQKGKLNFLIGLSYGSEGKGNVAAYIGEKCDFDFAISNHGPNSGHQFRDENDVTQTVKMLPVCGIVNKKPTIMLGSGSVIDINRLKLEMEQFNCADRVVISPTAAVVNDYCRDYEREHLKYNASTVQGTGAAIGLKAMRSPNIKVAKQEEQLQPYCRFDLSEAIIYGAENFGLTSLCEIAQGYGLSVDSEHYPFCTSRAVNVGQALGYLDVPSHLVGSVIGVARTYNIRVGNVEGGNSGNVFDDSKEVSWDEMSQKLGRNVLDMTTVTKRVRRVFTFSKSLFEMAVRRNGVDILFMTFWDYLNNEERKDMTDYLTSSKFNFKEIYTVSGFGHFDKFITRIK
jgi:adenylosuccinate synthase